MGKERFLFIFALSLVIVNAVVRCLKHLICEVRTHAIGKPEAPMLGANQGVDNGQHGWSKKACVQMNSVDDSKAVLGIMLLVVAVMPYLWMALLQNHSVVA